MYYFKKSKQGRLVNCSWWEELGLAKKLSFARDRPLECYFWTVGILPEPKYSECRIELAKTIAILLVIDDMYDSYAPLDELVIFTEAIRRFVYIYICNNQYYSPPSNAYSCQLIMMIICIAK